MNRLYKLIFTTVAVLLYVTAPATAHEPAMVFRLTGDSPGDGFTADYAYGDPEPAFLNEYEIIPDGAHGRAFRAPHSEEKLMSYLAPGNIYAQRGTLSFFVRMRDPVGGMPFKLFYVSYCDHSSLDMTWLRVDYNGMKGFDAFVTDANMARVRVRHIPDRFPEPDEWTHLAFSWDETVGVRLYMNGELVANTDTTSIFDAGLGLFQPFGRFATPGTVTSNCGHLRGADIDEIYIYNCMLGAEDIKRLARGETADDASPPVRRVSDALWRDEWLRRYGWDYPSMQPPALDDAPSWTIRKVEIHDARDQKKWVWRSNDGIRETVWPNAYNRSTLPGRSDYFIEPDWYTYSTSGKAISYHLPQEPWNYVEIIGAAFGAASHVIIDGESRDQVSSPLFTRLRDRERTFHMLSETRKGGTLRYVNAVKETPVAEMNVFNIVPGNEPFGLVTLSYTVTGADLPMNRSLDPLKEYLRLRYPADERSFALALPDRAPRREKTEIVISPMPVVHVLIPYQFRDEGPRTNAGAYAGFHYTWDGIFAGLDGIALDIPALDVPSLENDHIPLNIRVRDPLWPNRALMDVSVSVRPGEAKTLYLDTRDRILPRDRSFCIDIASPAEGFGPASIEGMNIRLVFKDRDDAVDEHVIDRFTQMRDNFGPNMTETRPQRTKLEHLQRFNADMHDLLAADPDHDPGRYYWKWWNPEQNTLAVDIPSPPHGVPEWAFLQTEVLKQWRYYLDWWIDNRQIENGEFGGGLSDDGDFANCMPPVALMGILPDRITESISRLMDSYYANGMFTDGLNTILTDALHTTEEGINVQPEVMLLKYGDPKTVERMLETAARYTDITRINDAGHRHFISRFYSSTFFATEEPWCWSSQFAPTSLAPGMVLTEFNGHRPTLDIVAEVGRDLLAHETTSADGAKIFPLEINFRTDEGRKFTTGGYYAQMLGVLARWTGDPVFNRFTPRYPGSHGTIARDRLADSYRSVYQYNGERMYIATDGWPWDDGPYISIGNITSERLGGMPIRRGQQFPKHVLSWRFDPPYDGTAVAIVVPDPSPESVKIVAYNVMKGPVTASLTGWGVDPGEWEIAEGVDRDGDDIPDGDISTRTERFERSQSIQVTFPPRQVAVINMTLKRKGTPYWDRPDLGIGEDDITVGGRSVTVRVHSLGSVPSPPSEIALVDANGAVLSRKEIRGMNGLTGYEPVTGTVSLSLPRNIEGEVRAVIDPDGSLIEVTRMNNTVVVQK